MLFCFLKIIPTPLTIGLGWGKGERYLPKVKDNSPLVKDILQKVKDIFPQTASNDFVLSCLPFKVKEVKDILSNYCSDLRKGIGFYGNYILFLPLYI